MIYLLESKDEALEKFKEFVASTYNKFKKKVKILRTDNGGEYINKAMDTYLKQQGIRHQTTTPYSPAQNGVAERKNRTLVEMTRCMINDAKLNDKFWGEAIFTATYLQNRLPTKANEVTPYELWNGHKPNLKHIKVFGSTAYAYIHKHRRSKMDSKAIKGIFVGYDHRSKGYRIYCDKRDVMISRTVKILEGSEIHEETETVIPQYRKNQETSIQLPESEEEERQDSKIEDKPTETDEENEERILPRRSERTTKGIPPQRYGYQATKADPEPKTYEEVLSLQNPERKLWIKAANEEMESLKENKTWEIVDPPEDKKVIGCKWVFKRKYNENGNIEKYKARLVAKGYDQIFGSDYDETFAPTASHTTIRTFLTVAAHKKMSINHLDVKSAFLHGQLDEEIYMNQPEGYINPGEEEKVCKLKKAIYGLKQAAKAWYTKIAESLQNIGFKQSTADNCLFSRKEKNEVHNVYILLYVDDILVASQNDKKIEEVIKLLQAEYQIKNLGNIKHYLGIEIERNKDGSFLLSQKNKIQELVHIYKLHDAKPTYTPMETGYLQDSEETGYLSKNTEFRQIVGALLHIASVSRPDISASVNILSRRSERPRNKDLTAAKRIIRYLQTTKDKSLQLKAENHHQIIGYADSDYAGDKTDRKSTSGYIFFLGQSPISWKTRKQACIALSTAEAEYISLSEAAKELTWLVSLLQDLTIEQQLPIKLYEDNQAAIKLSQSEKYHNRTKHIDVRYHHIRDLQERQVLQVNYCATEDMIADLFTKPLAKPRLEVLISTIYVAPHLKQKVGVVGQN